MSIKLTIIDWFSKHDCNLQWRHLLRNSLLTLNIFIDTCWWYVLSKTWWRHQMEALSALLTICAGNSPVTGEFPSQRPVTRSFDVFFDLHLNKRSSEQSRRRWFETPSCPLWRHCNESFWQRRPCNTYFGVYTVLTHWGRVTHICVGDLTIIESCNGLSPGWRQAIIWTNAGILLIGLLG